MLSRLILVAGIFLLASAVFAQEEVWEGNAAVVSEGVFEVEGLYAASNAFPENTTVRVENSRTGKAVSVKIIRRIEDNPNLFILLSHEAAGLIGLNKGDVERVRTSVAPEALAQIPTTFDELVDSPDSDINPIAIPRSLEESSKPLAEKQLAEAASPEAALPPVETEKEIAAEQFEEDTAAVEAVLEAEEAVAAEVEPVIVDEEPSVEETAVDEETEELAPLDAVIGETESAGDLATKAPEVVAAEPPPLKTEPEVSEETAAAAEEPAGPFPSLEPPRAAEETLAFSEIKPVPPEKAEEDRPIASVDPPQPQMTEQAFQALSPDTPRGVPSELTPPGVGEHVLAFSEIAPELPAEEDVEEVAAAEEAEAKEIDEIDEDQPVVTEVFIQADEEEAMDLTEMEPASPLSEATPEMPVQPEGYAAEDSLLFLVPPEYLVEGDLEPASPDEAAGEEEFLLAEAAVPGEAEAGAIAEEAAAENVDMVETAAVEEVDEYPAVVPDETEAGIPADMETAEVEEPEVTGGQVSVEEQPELVLVPTEPKPPEGTGETTAAASESEKAAVDVTTERVVAAVMKPAELGAFQVSHLPADRIEGRTYFIQLGAYNSEILASKVEDTYSDRYPVAVLASGSETGNLYRVFIGPLNQDESGTLLHWFQAKGFHDAFLRSAN